MPVPDFSPGEVLTAAAMDSISGWLVGSGTATAGGANITIANCFSSLYSSYKVVLSGIKCTTGTRFIQLQLRASGSTSATNYYWTTAEAGAVFTLASGASPDSVYRCGIVIDSSKFAGGTIEIQNAGAAQETSFQSSGTDPRTGGQFLRMGNGFHNVATAYTDLVISVAADTWATGTVRVYGYRD